MFKPSSKWVALAVIVSGFVACGSEATPDEGAHAEGGVADGKVNVTPERDGGGEPTTGEMDQEGGPRADDDAGPMLDATGADGGRDCHAIETSHPDEGALHLELCSPAVYNTNPPSSGNHYGYWAAYQTYASTFPRGFWVHNLEHGAVVITYNCPGGCADEVAAAQQLIDALPGDCPAPSPRRIVMLPDPALDVRFAASAWGYTLRADCFDAPAFTDFIAAHYGHGLENVCGAGIDPLTAGNGAPVCAP